MSKQYEILICPFCKKGEISCLYFPSTWSEKHGGRNSLGRGVSVSKSASSWIVQSGCGSCGKSQVIFFVKLGNQPVKSNFTKSPTFDRLSSSQLVCYLFHRVL